MAIFSKSGHTIFDTLVIEHSDHLTYHIIAPVLVVTIYIVCNLVISSYQWTCIWVPRWCSRRSCGTSWRAHWQWRWHAPDSWTWTWTAKWNSKLETQKNKFKVPKSCGAVIYQRSEIWIQSFLDPTNCIEKVNLKLHWLHQITTTLLQFHWQFQVHFWVLLPKLINSFANLLHRTWCKFRWWQKIVS